MGDIGALAGRNICAPELFGTSLMRVRYFTSMLPDLASRSLSISTAFMETTNHVFELTLFKYKHFAKLLNLHVDILSYKKRIIQVEDEIIFPLSLL